MVFTGDLEAFWKSFMSGDASTKEKVKLTVTFIKNIASHLDKFHKEAKASYDDIKFENFLVARLSNHSKNASPLHN